MSGYEDGYDAAMEQTNSLNYEPPLFARGKCEMIDCREISDDELVRTLREAASSWFNNDQLLMLEELIRRAKLGRELTLIVTADQYLALNNVANFEGATMTSIVRRAIAQELVRIRGRRYE